MLPKHTGHVAQSKQSVPWLLLGCAHSWKGKVFWKHIQDWKTAIQYMWNLVI